MAASCRLWPSRICFRRFFERSSAVELNPRDTCELAQSADDCDTTFVEIAHRVTTPVDAIAAADTSLVETEFPAESRHVWVCGYLVTQADGSNLVARAALEGAHARIRWLKAELGEVRRAPRDLSAEHVNAMLAELREAILAFEYDRRLACSRGRPTGRRRTVPEGAGRRRAA
ncbi:hypothetical protein BVI2075_1680009 [Burkholderia vietnamiensis]|nr:hypothetical protein BVI2075_1680009 [Burkholderia vietnamiensis]